jgi:hypothetical protein
VLPRVRDMSGQGRQPVGGGEHLEVFALGSGASSIGK